MKKYLIILLTVGLMLAGCSGALHNLSVDSETTLTLELENFPVSDGQQDWRGSFDTDAWNDQDVRLMQVSGGYAVYMDTSKTAITDSTFEFTLVDPGSWNRSWIPATGGNVEEYGSMQKFQIEIPLDGATHAIKIDGSTASATIYLDGEEVE